MGHPGACARRRPDTGMGRAPFHASRVRPHDRPERPLAAGSLRRSGRSGPVRIGLELTPAGLASVAGIARRVAAVALACAVISAGAASAAPQLRPWLLIEQEFTDNVDLSPDDDRQSAFVTRVTPGLIFRGRTSRFQGGVNAALPARYTTNGEDSGFRVEGALTGDGVVELVPGRLLLEGEASISQQVLNNAAAQSTANQDTVQVYRLSPVVRQRFDAFAIGELRYTLGQIFVNSDEASNTTAHVGQASLANGNDFDRLRWSLNNRISKSIRSDASDVDQADSIAQAEYGLTRWFSPIVAGGYQRFDSGGSRADFDGPAYYGGFRWRPGRRTELAVTYGKRDDRFSPAARLTYQITEDSRLVASYAEGLSTAQQRLSTNLSFIGIDRETGQFIDERFETPFDPRADPFNIDDQIVYIKEARIALGLVRGRYAFGLQGYFGREEDVDTGEEEEIYRADVTWSRRLGRNLSVNLTGGVEFISFPTGRDDDEYLVQPGLSYQLSPRALLFADYRYRWQNSNDRSAEYTENRVAVGVRLSR
jgi:uncharacterized protein (PEP-CTERM system associated)